MKNIAIFTTFTSADPAYSLNRVVQDQIKMLVDHNYPVKVIVAEGFKAEEMYANPLVTLAYIPSVPCHNEVRMDTTFNQDVRSLEGVLTSVLQDVDVVLTHDVTYQPACLKHLIASKRIAKTYPHIRWLHWIHSATSPYLLANLAQTFTDEFAKEIRVPFPNSYYVFFNDYMVPSIAKNYDVDESFVKVVHHPTDIGRYWKFSDRVMKLVKEKDMLNADAIAFTAVRLDRGKQVEYIIKIMGQMKTLQTDVRVIVADFHSTGGDKVTYRDELKHIAIDWGLNEKEITFCSEFQSDWHLNMPYEDSADLMKLANVFIQPSRSESYSLVTQEAGLQGNVMMLNQDWPPFRDIFGKMPLYRKFSSNADILEGIVGTDTQTNTKYTNEYSYMLSCAAAIKAELINNRVVAEQTFLRKYRNTDYIFRNELEVLFNFEEVK